MNSRIGTACWVLSLLLFATVMPAKAGFVGDTVSVDYDWPTLGTVIYSGGSATVAQSGTNFAVGGGIAAVVTDTSVQVSYPNGWLFNSKTPKTFDGWVITDLQANITGASVTASNVSGFAVTFDSTHVYISDLVSSQYPAGAFIAFNRELRTNGRNFAAWRDGRRSIFFLRRPGSEPDSRWGKHPIGSRIEPATGFDTLCWRIAEWHTDADWQLHFRHNLHGNRPKRHAAVDSHCDGEFRAGDRGQSERAEFLCDAGFHVGRDAVHRDHQ